MPNCAFLVACEVCGYLKRPHWPESPSLVSSAEPFPASVVALCVGAAVAAISSCQQRRLADAESTHPAVRNLYSPWLICSDRRGKDGYICARDCDISGQIRLRRGGSGHSQRDTPGEVTEPSPFLTHPIMVFWVNGKTAACNPTVLRILVP